MEILRETTVWSTGYKVPNHTYILDGSKLVGYIQEGKTEPFMFKIPQSFSKSGRKFEKVGNLKVFRELMQKTVSNRRQVIGSKGNIYTVDDSEGTCTCAGFTYRGTCKHLKKD